MIVPMRRLTLVAMKDDEESILKALQSIAAVEIISSGDMSEGGIALDKCEDELCRLNNALKLLKPYAAKKGLAPLPVAALEDIIGDVPAAQAICDNIELLDRELASIKTEIEKRRSLIAALTPWRSLTVPIERIRPSRNVRYITGFIKHDDLELLSDTDAAVEEISDDRECAVLIACHTNEYDSILRILKDVNFAEYTFPALTGTVQENILALSAEISELESSGEKKLEQLRLAAAERDALGRAYDATAIERDREAGKSALTLTDYAFILEGWMRNDDEERVRAAIASVTDVFHFESREPAEDEIPPTEVKNNAFVRPFEYVTNMYSRPAYSGIDAASAVTPFYLLFFGMMLSDSGYGLLLFIGGILYQKLLRPRGSFAELVKLITLCGLSTVFCGLALGTFFGMNWVDIFGAGTIFPLIDPLSEIMTMIYLCCGLGIVHMMTGIAVKMYICFRDGDAMAAIFDHFSWMLLIVGLVLLLAGSFASMPILGTIGTYMALLGAVMILLFAGRSKKNVFKRVGGGLGALYNVTSYLGDTLSYVRILALGLVTGAMGNVFNLVGGMIFNGLSGMGIIGTILGFIFAAAVLIAMHAFSLFINALGTYVHCARLQYVEYFGKFYDSNGLAFRPLRYDSKYVDIKNNQY